MNSHELAILRVCKNCGDEHHKKRDMEKVGDFYYCHFCLLEGDDYQMDDDFVDAYANPKGGIQ